MNNLVSELESNETDCIIDIRPYCKGCNTKMHEDLIEDGICDDCAEF